jgi:hypothetical protein
MVRPGLAIASAVLMLLSACGGSTVTSDRDRPVKPIEATAYSNADGAETWDLTGQPSDQAFGIEKGSSTAIYETPQPRRVRIVLPGRTVETETDLVDFRRDGSGGDYSFRVSTPQTSADEVTSMFRHVLGQLGLDDAAAVTFDRDVSAAPADQSEVIDVGVGEDVAVLGDWSVAPSARFTPLAKLGRVVLAGMHLSG